MRIATLISVLSVAALLFTTGCSRRDESGTRVAEEASDSTENIITDASLLTIVEKPGYSLVDVVNPWDTTEMLGRYLLLSRGNVAPDSVAKGYTTIEVPLQKSLIYSGIHAGVFNELGAADAVAAVADGEYITAEPFAGRLARGEIVNVGSSQAPSLEAIVALALDAALVSPFPNANNDMLTRAGVAVVECADYMEGTPLGRAEWMRFYGRLVGRGNQADSLFLAIKERYNQVRDSALKADSRPIVLTEMLTDGYWFVPGGASYMARFIIDAGGQYPWASDHSSGSLQLDYSSVYARAADADVWLIRSFGHDLTLADVESVYLLNNQFKAFKDKNVWVANTAEVPLFEEFPFHPDLLLTEYASIFHPEASFVTQRYYKRAR